MMTQEMLHTGCKILRSVPDVSKYVIFGLIMRKFRDMGPTPYLLDHTVRFLRHESCAGLCHQDGTATALAAVLDVYVKREMAAEARREELDSLFFAMDEDFEMIPLPSDP
jgi:hypothetical protein